jgi:hypothetical protein
MIRCSLIRVGLATIALACVGFASESAFSQQKSLKDQMVGMWTLVSADTTDKDGKKTPFLDGADIKGMLVFAANGKMLFQAISNSIPVIASKDRMNTTAQEEKAVAHGTLSYWGTYSVSEPDGVVTLKIERSTFPNQTLADGKRIIKMTGADDMKWETPSRSAGGRNDLVWRRVK